jgi:hypothetical protein
MAWNGCPRSVEYARRLTDAQWQEDFGLTTSREWPALRRRLDRIDPSYRD